ncbi:MAG TPA: GntR family transcriptional regulator [Actinomycetales bacterium]|nr:GntR family transcriptional regulator [Actinomycetales bacterium]
MSSNQVDGPVFPQFEGRQSIRQQVAHALRAALVSGQMRPGVLYSAPALASQFGVSATPIREAMLDLVKEGLVIAVRNKGFRVTELSDTELDEISAIRTLIEAPTVGEVARLCDDAMAPRLEELRVMARRIVDCARHGDLIEYVEVDRQFHLALLALAGNEQLVRVVGELRARSRLYGLNVLVERGELVHSAKEHEQLVDLVLANDADGAETLMRRHIRHVRGTWAGAVEPDDADGTS